MPKRQNRPRRRGPRITAARQRGAEAVGALVKPGLRVAVTTHVNADGDGVGSEVALVRLLRGLGVNAAITNPTPFPDRYRFLLKGIERYEKSATADKYLRRAQAVFVLDISDVGRIGHLGRTVAALKVPVACIDHHVTEGSLPAGPRFVDSAASATGELIYDLARVMEWEINAEVARALYVALLTDTGGFRFSNTTPHVLTVAASLLEFGLGPEEIYEDVFANSPEGSIRLLAEVLNTLVVEEHGLAWVTVPEGALERCGIDADGLEGVVEYPRSIQGVRLALLFRRLANGRTKVSFRSLGDVDAAALAQEFGGGGHIRAAGASVHGELPEVQNMVLERAREVLRK